MNVLNFIKKHFVWFILLLTVIVGLTIGLTLHFRKIRIAEKYGYMQAEGSHYNDLSYASREMDSVEGPGQFETASDMPEATASYTNPDLSFL